MNHDDVMSVDEELRDGNTPTTTTSGDPPSSGGVADVLMEDQSSHPSAVTTQHDFLVSFIVDARGGTMTGCRYSGIKVFLPPKTAPEPMSISCRYQRPENILHPPPFNEGEALACKILQMSPPGQRFLGPVLIEIPHAAALRNSQRELVILRSDTGKKWYEHHYDDQAAVEKCLVESMNESLMASLSLDSTSSPRLPKSPTSSPFRSPNRRRQWVRIVCSDFPQYFAVITRCRQEIEPIGSDGAVLSSKLVPRAQVLFPSRSLTKRINVGLCVQAIEDELVEEIMVQGGAVSPIITIEPRRRKFHKAITITIPLPERLLMLQQHHDQQQQLLMSKTIVPQENGGLSSSSSSSSPRKTTDDFVPIEMSLKLMCSMSGNFTKACWEDVTQNTPMSFINGAVQFTSLVSASFWLINCPNWMSQDVMSLVEQLYKNTIRVPYLARFHVFAKRRPEGEHEEVVHIRVLCLTDVDIPETIVELQEDYKEICFSDETEVFDKSELIVRFGGNVEKLESEDVKLVFKPFRENRQTFTVRRKNLKNPYAKGTIALLASVNDLLFESKIDVSKLL